MAVYLPLGWGWALVIVNIIGFALVLVLNISIVQCIIINEQCLIFATDVQYSHPLIRVFCNSLTLPTKDVDIDVHSSAALI
jgi:hypothetical protein